MNGRHEDAEIEAMGAISRALGSLPADAVERVLRWANDRFGESRDEHMWLRQVRNASVHAGSHVAPRRQEFSPAAMAELGHMLSHARDATEQERVLLAAAWASDHRGGEPFSSRDLSTVLSELGHRPSNISVQLGRLADSTPPTIEPVRRSGPKGLRYYTITDAGRARALDVLVK